MDTSLTAERRESFGRNEMVRLRRQGKARQEGGKEPDCYLARPNWTEHRTVHGIAADRDCPSRSKRAKRQRHLSAHIGPLNPR